MNRNIASLLSILVVLTAGPAFADGALMTQPKSMAQVIGGLVPLIPGANASVEAFLNAHTPAPTLGQSGWRHAPIDYRTREKALLHIQLISDWQNRTAPDVVRLVATVDSETCVDAATIQRELAQRGDMAWTSEGPDEGWVGQSEGHVVGLGQRHARCLTVFTIDNRRQPRPSPPTRALRVDPSGRIVPVPMPGR